MKKTILLAMLFLQIIFISFAQKEIDFQTKNLTKELNKLGENLNLVMSEIALQGYDEGLALSGKYFHVNDNTNQNPVKYIYVGRCFISRSPGQTVNNKGHEYFDYFIFYDESITIRLVSIYNYKSAYGQGITNKNWLKQFIGYNMGKQLNPGINIDAVSGATLSAGSIVYDIRNKTNLLMQLLER